MKKVQFLKLAQLELDDAVTWYNSQSSNLGVRFLDELDKAVRRIVAYPLSCPKIETNLGRGLLARFPYGIIYGIDSDSDSSCSTSTQRAKILDWQITQGY